MASESLNKEFTVKITRAMPESNGSITETFRCSNVPYNNADDNISGNWYRGEAHIEEAAGVFKNVCDISIYGIGLDKLNSITYTWWEAIRKVPKVSVVEVIVDGITVFIGNTYNVLADFSNAPDVCLRIIGVTGTYLDAIIKPSQNFEGMKIYSVFEALANEAGMTILVADEIDGICPKTTLSGSILHRIVYLGKQLNLNVDIENNTIRVGKHGKALPDFQTSIVEVINKENGLIGYPTFNNQGVNFSTLFNTKLRTGKIVEIESIVPKVKGRYYIAARASTLSSLPNGQWRSNYIATSVNVRGK